jgi:hypothetical protein
MKILGFIIAIVLASCRYASESPVITKPLNSKDTTITLKDTLGKITVSIPYRYDTFLVWTHYSDCSSCGYEKYRFQPTSLPIYRESGWIWEDRKDSVDQFTIEHSQFVRLNDSLPFSALKTLHEKMLDDAKYDPFMYQDKYRLDTIQEIKGKEFSIITSDSYNDSTKIFSKAVWATTFLKGNVVKFQFNLLTQKNDSISKFFVRDSKQLLYQIKTNGL